eukprot:gnl/TRDRNA2_/TRDRNA2_139950_c1_seq1.p1 gnl/TRDRNA2_/TRDRNA2_139950_c1~~gnl/TRDRNA2_/TRDRNA2_139950_c1_seq1.p1  ORF type:complete len:374 (-),score=69.36 gnl/TRDRNA2_/TRDRNA2_139950_c1_seq1:11-1132(-)
MVGTFFTMPGWGWNVFDCVVVTLQAFEEMMMAFGEVSTHEFFLPSGVFMRIIRLLRIGRIIRILRVLHILTELRALVMSLLMTVKAFFWAVLLLFGMIYVFGVYITQLTLDYRLSKRESGENTSEAYDSLQTSFGSLDRTILSLYKALSGGIDWGDLADPLISEISPFIGFVFVIFVAFTMLAMMNVVTGVFVDTALQRAREEKEITLVSQARKLFATLDQSNDGVIHFSEFERHMGTQEMQKLLREIDVDPSEARCLFEILDMNGEGSIDGEEFLSGCVRLQGPAKALDLCLVTRETRRMFERFQRRGAAMEAHLQRISSTRAQMEQHISEINEVLKGMVVNKGSLQSSSLSLAARQLWSEQSGVPLQWQNM